METPGRRSSRGRPHSALAPQVRLWLILASLVGGVGTPVSTGAGELPAPLPTIETKTAGLDARPGFLPLYWDARAGQLYLEVPASVDALLYVVFLETGLGSNPVGLDRGQVGPQRIVRFERSGPRLRLVEPNQRYRAVSADPFERRAVEESFATSTLWAGTIVAESPGRVLVEANDLCVSDAHGVARTLEQTEQGSFQLDTDRSAFLLERTRAFPKNTEISVELTFASNRPGPWVRETAPTPQSLSLRLRHSFIALPEPGYIPRAFDPRIGGFYQGWLDYAAALEDPLDQRFLERHRLRKADPTAPVSAAVEPIVYYVDRGAPEPVRSALLDGARWWTQAFEAAGFRGAFRVELLPEEADPLDIRFNVIQWVHRSTRGWSYGSTITDPRTGEILKGHVTLGSLRVRQDRRIFEGLFGRGPLATELALARIRQLAAHEVGHTLGFSHNFAASANGRASVMDYPAPWIGVRDDGGLDASEAYGVGIGAWDILTTRYAYSEFENEEAQARGLRAILDEATNGTLAFASDEDARPDGAGHPLANLWDNGDDPVAALEEILRVRRIALERFGSQNLPPGRPLSELEDVLVPVYLLHRYQIDAVSKSVGGALYAYDIVDDVAPAVADSVGDSIEDSIVDPDAGSARGSRAAVAPVAADTQRRALQQLAQTLSVEVLRLPGALLDAIPPAALGFDDSRERFPRHTAMYFDPIAAARVAADMTVSNLLQPERARRLQTQGWTDPTLPDFDEVISTLLEATWAAAPAADAYGRAIQREVQRSVLETLVSLAGHRAASADVRAAATAALRDLAAQIASARGAGDSLSRRHRELAREEITRFLERPYDPERAPEALSPPPGSPIGERSGPTTRCDF